MFDTTLVASNPRREAKRKLATLPAALAVHALAIALVMAGQLWAVSEVSEPFLPVVFVPPTAPPAAGTVGGDGAGRRRPQQAAVHRQPVQPVVVPDERAQAGKPDDPPDDPNEVPGGDPRGTGTGVVGGADPNVEITLREVEPPDDPPIIVSPNVTAPIPLVRTVPEYPELARKVHKEGVVIVQAVIDRHGNVVGAEVLRDIGLGCGAAAAQAILGWKYRPALLDGRPVSVYLTVTFNFELRGVS